VIGQILNGKYRLLRLLGQGGMGAVYEAQHVDTGRRLAVKVIHRELINDAILARFEREARAAGAIETQHIAEVIDAGKDAASGTPYLVMEYLEGEDLQHLLERLGPLPPDLALRIAAQACLGLAKAHEASVVHRDIKPGNIFLARREEGEIIVKIVDFGIAKIKAAQLGQGEGTGLTRTGTIVGTPLYMSPEQARGLREIDHRTDVWSLGVVLYHALAGHPPHEEALSFGDLIAAILGKPARPLQEAAPWVPAEVAAVVQRAMAPEPGDRFPTMMEMHAALKALLPEGAALSEAQMVGLGEAARAFVATRLPAPTHAVVEATLGPGATLSALESQKTVAAAPLLAASSPVAPTRSRARLPLVLALLGGAVVLGLGGFGIYRTLGPGAALEGAVELPVALSASSASATTAPPPSATATSAPTPPEILRPDAPRRVKVVILPADALVEVEGVRVRGKDGVIEISGTLGSVHKVRVFKGKLETEGEVIVTESGAIPPKIELGAPRPRPSASAAPSATPSKPVPRETFQ
jgi:serine/threonine-protein kinase